ncbi:competence protein ComEC [Herbaspirillum sp. Sphag1AN]|uniref:DNA internalization-related competence protein ComEC/Rec2 n=1 Tax=unclassified Herbaspirillum TaxID=2624150 RepID=UPI0016212B06|nr:MULTISPECIES: DNA internalization-related competence protein ComEC/Rec2 [unclassified Herbaspirillum]MBB3210784.1 competence protein ComEC [Herbaspirillum sp. Sphag1AN]MBB3244414.1 competence protein ComEC [Herbaspirillum sp. Sphag64]
MRSAILGLVLGIALLQMQASLLPMEMQLGLLGAALLLCLFAWALGWRQLQLAGLRKWLRMLLFCVAGACFGFGWADYLAQTHLDEALPAAWEGRDITVVGVVDSLPTRFARGVRFHFQVERVAPQGNQIPQLPSRLALTWYDQGNWRAVDGDEQVTAVAAAPLPQAQAPAIKAGERWQLTVRLKRPHGNANPAGFDYEVWLLEQNLRATGSVRPDQQLAYKNQRLSAFIWTPRNVLDASRGWLRERILTALADRPYAGVIVALVIGDQRAIESDDWTVFNRTGVGHLVAISGLHISLVAGLFATLMLFLWRRSFFTRAQLPLLLPAPKVALLAGFAGATGYALLAGFGIPAQRTLYMLLVVGAAYWSGRLTPLSYVLPLALAAVLLFDPWALLWPGFWLSFAAVALILYASAGRVGSDAVVESQMLSPLARYRQPSAAKKMWHKVRTGAYTQYVVTLGLLPLTMMLFGQYSLVSPVANAVAIPVITLVVVPLSLIGSIVPTPLSDWLLLGAHETLAWLAQWLSWLSSQPFALWRLPLPAPWMFAVALIGTLWLLAPRGWPARWLGWFCWLPLLLNPGQGPQEGAMQVTALDIGQGMAVLVETSTHRLLYDTGPDFGDDADAGNRVILPYLRARGIDHLDAMVISHSHSDHAGGALSLLREIAVDNVISSLPAAHPIVKAALQHQRCLQGQRWQWDGADFQMLYPVQALYDSDKWGPNALSCVLKVSLGKHAILLPGDLEAAQEAQLLNSELAGDLRADVLLAPHHGSGTSSSLPFLQAVRPSVALFQVGYLNRFHHPKPEIYARYGQLGILRLRTDDAGAITMDLDEQQLQLGTYRQNHARYWFGR